MATGRQKKVAVTVLVLVVLVWSGVGLVMLARWWDDQRSQTSSLERGVDGNTTITKEEANLADLVKKVSPTVVSVVSTNRATCSHTTSSTPATPVRQTPAPR